MRQRLVGAVLAALAAMGGVTARRKVNQPWFGRRTPRYAR